MFSHHLNIYTDMAEVDEVQAMCLFVSFTTQPFTVQMDVLSTLQLAFFTILAYTSSDLVKVTSILLLFNLR